MLKINKILIAILLLSVFVVGTLSFADTVNAAVKSVDNQNNDYIVESKEKSVWKKFDSGSFNDKGWKGLKDKKHYVSYSKGSKDIKMNLYGHATKNNKKIFLGTLYISKTGNKIKTQWLVSGKKLNPEYFTTKMTVKQFYNSKVKS